MVVEAAEEEVEAVELQPKPVPQEPVLPQLEAEVAVEGHLAEEVE